MKKIRASIACALFLCATSALARVPQVLGVWEFDPQASELPTGFLLASPLAEFQINGTKTPITYSEPVLDEHAVNVVAKYGDRVVNKGVRRVAPDGKTMRIDVTAIDDNGKETPFFLVSNQVR